MKFIQEKKFALTASFMVLTMLGVFLFPVKLNAANEPIKVAIVGNSMSEFFGDDCGVPMAIHKATLWEGLVNYSEENSYITDVVNNGQMWYS